MSSAGFRVPHPALDAPSLASASAKATRTPQDKEDRPVPSGVAYALRTGRSGSWTLGGDLDLLAGIAGATPSSPWAVHPDDAKAPDATAAVDGASDRPAVACYRLVEAHSGREIRCRETRLKLPGDTTLVLVQDASRERQLEIDIDIAKISAEAATRGKMAFLSSIDHEFRTPLNTIIGFSEIIQGQVLGPIGNVRYAGYVDDIHAGGRMLLALVDRLLDLAKADSGTLALHEEDTDLAKLIADTGELMRQAAERASLRLGVEIAGDLPHVFIDPHKIGRALVALLENAIRFTLTGGSVTIGARVAENGGVVMTVADDGLGMDPVEAQSLLDAAPQKHGRKSGLGLPLARRLIERHGGHLSIASGAPRGTVLTIALPRFRSIRSTPVAPPSQPQPAASAAGTTWRQASSPNRRILCVDPDPIVPRIIRQSLREIGDRSEVLWRDTAKAGLDAMAQQRPDVVLADWRLQDETGAGLADLIAARSAETRLPVVLLSDIELRPPADKRPSEWAGRWLLKTELTAANVKAALALAFAKPPAN